ncbi:MAG: UvrD-helicase domain-containing protein [Treponemataceae bacterium]|nr:UvrD-helicase domain-containing protein [Treponemataceae bacterium]
MQSDSIKANKPTPEQFEVINTTECPLLVIAGPGAGKTKTLVDRVIHLIVDMKVPAGNIMVATFTEKAAKDLLPVFQTKRLLAVYLLIFLICTSGLFIQSFLRSWRNTDSIQICKEITVCCDTGSGE